MKKCILFIGAMFFGLFNTVALAQGSWNLQTNPTTHEGQSTKFVSVNEGWINLSSNSVLHTTNGGTTWSEVTLNATDLTFGVDATGQTMSFISPSTGWVMKTRSNANEDALGAVVYKTIDGGATWNPTVLSSTIGDVGIQLQFVDANHGWALVYNMNTGTPTFLKTTNGGTNWTPTNGGGIFYYVNSTIGYAFAAGPTMLPPYTIYKTTDGGTSWTPQYTDNTTGQFDSIHFSDATHGWIVGENGKILKTVDGTNWTTVTCPLIDNSYENLHVQFLTTNLGWIATRDSMNNQFILKTTNGGTTWTKQQLPFLVKTYSMFFWDENHGWATSDRYNNGGTSIPGRIARYFYDPAGTYNNATLNGPWFYYTPVTPIDPYNDNLGYIIFNGNGTITGMNGFIGGPPPSTYGWYSVAANGQITGELILGNEMFPLGGTLTSPTTGTVTADGSGFTFTKISNPGELQDNISGTISANECGQRFVGLNINSLGEISGVSAGFSQALGHVFADQGVFIGHFYTGDVQPWTEITISGYYNNGILTGFSSFDWQSCGNGAVNLVRNILSNIAFSAEKAITIYPNPNNGHFNIKFNEPKDNIQIEIYNQLGQRVYKEANRDQKLIHEIYFEPQAKGIYYITINDGKNIFKEKIMIK